MSRVYWSILIGVAVVAGGLFLGVAGLLLAPIIGAFAIIALVFWLAERKTQHKPPVE
jgi:predicted PurR-regulated permease PerM